MRTRECSAILRAIMVGMFFFVHASAANRGTGEIHGTVKSPDGPVVGATVRILDPERTTHTGANGEFTFPDVPIGTYKVFVRVVGYASAMNTVVVTDNTAEIS